jgi:hypothetical protein
VDLTDASCGLLLLKQCFNRCEPDASIEVVVGEELIPCKPPKYDGGPERCVDGSTPITEDICKHPKDLPPLPPGVEVLSEAGSGLFRRDFIPGEFPTEVWTAEHPEAPWECACGGKGFDGDAGACKFRTDDFLDGGVESTVTIPAAPGIPEQTLTITNPIPNGKKWEKPSEDHQIAHDGDWKGNCRRMPCGTWSGMDPLPAECRADEFKDVECGMGKAGKRKSADQSEDDAGRPMTCVANKWVRSCDPTWECGEGKWYRENCGTCAKPVNDPDAGLCYKEPKCRDHKCVVKPVNCKKLDGD